MVSTQNEGDKGVGLGPRIKKPIKYYGEWGDGGRFEGVLDFPRGFERVNVSSLGKQEQTACRVGYAQHVEYGRPTLIIEPI